MKDERRSGYEYVNRMFGGLVEQCVLLNGRFILLFVVEYGILCN